MKKRYLMLILIMMFTFIGCGKKESDLLETEPVLEEKQTEDAAEIQTEEIANAEVVEEELKFFECSEEIKTAEPQSGLVQVDDMIFQYGCTVAEALETINGSECTYTTESSENQLVTKNGFVQMVFKKDGEWYFELDAQNMTEETVGLKDCLVNRITVHKAAKGNFFYAGVYDDENSIITYGLVKEMLKDFEVYSERESYNGGEEKMISLAYVTETSKSPSNKMYMFFIFESDTGELKMFSLNSHSVAGIGLL